MNVLTLIFYIHRQIVLNFPECGSLSVVLCIIVFTVGVCLFWGGWGGVNKTSVNEFCLVSYFFKSMSSLNTNRFSNLQPIKPPSKQQPSKVASKKKSKIKIIHF